MKNDDWYILDDNEEPLSEEQQEALQKAYTVFIKNFMDLSLIHI